MAGDWIKVEHSMPDKPEVDQLAAKLDIEHDAAVGKLLRFWIWADQQSVDGDALGVTPAFLDRLTNCPGFSAALIAAGWLIDRSGRLSVPHFDRHNGQTAKARALTKDRMKRSRYAQNVTTPSPEKRREEKSIKKESKPKKDMPPTVEEVLAYCLERKNEIDAEAFINHYQSKGWKIGKSPMRDWRAAVRTWEKNKKPAASRVATAEDLARWNPVDGGLGGGA